MNKATTAAPDLPPGTVIDGTYTTGAVVRARLGSVTYAATDLSGSRVDVTVYAPECFVSPVALERSLRELRQLEKVHSPHVLRVIDAGKLPQGGIYEVHEHSEGQSLAEIGALAPREVQRMIPEIVAGLQAAQKVGVLHRNLGAEAVLRGDRGIQLTGFAVGDPQGGVSFGALDCIAPEQVEGKNIDERTLVYNLAALTYRFLRGASLFTGGDSGTQLLQAAASLPPSESMPAPLFAALAKDPKSRPNLLQRFLTDLEAIVRDFQGDEGEGSERAEAPRPLSARDPDPTSFSPKGGEEREVSDTLSPLMTDPDAPKLPSSDAEAGPATASGAHAAPSTPAARPATIPPRPAIITGPGMLGAPPAAAAKPPPGLGAPGPSTGGLPNAPSLGSLGKPTLPTIGTPPTLGKPPGLPSLTPPGVGPVGPIMPPGVSAPNLSAPNLSAPNLAAPNLAAPNLSAPPVGAPSVGAPAPSATPSTGATSAKPRTRGWTMFMEVTEDEAGASATPGVPLPGAPVAATPVAAAPVPAPAPVAPVQAATPAPAAPAATGEVKPSTRGWTMIMDDPEEAADPAAIGLSTPAAAASPPPPSPTTRGWTMLEELNDSLPAAAAPIGPVTPAGTPAVAAAATPAAEASGAGGAPSSRGWTMFMEAELQGGAKPEDAPQPDAEPQFYDGPVQTESGTTVAFAPTAAEPNASFRKPEPAATPDLGSQEPMTSFGARLRGEPEDAAPAAASLSAESAPSVSAQIPSFAGNNLGFVAVKPPQPAETPAVPAQSRPEPQPDALDSDIEAAGGGNTKLIVIGVVVVVAIVIAIILATS